jgi:hypothetical protein
VDTAANPPSEASTTTSPKGESLRPVPATMLRIAVVSGA